MWLSEVTPLAEQAGFRVSLLDQGQRVSYAELIEALVTDAGRAAALGDCLAAMPFAAFFWETRPVCRRSTAEPFECVVLPAPALARAAPDAQSFAEHFSSTRSVVRFDNLGGDATLVVPCPRAELGVYPHLAAFLRGAPAEQRAELLREVGLSARARSSAAPFWLSTSGLGVAWVHVRIDSRPKYYQYTPYRRHPSGAAGDSS